MALVILGGIFIPMFVHSDPTTNALAGHSSRGLFKVASHPLGFDRNGNDGTFTHQTTWAQQPDAGYGWQRFGDLASVPRESFEAGNFIVLHRADSGDAVVRFAGADRIATAVAVSQAAFAPGGARAAVIARSDTYPDALAGAPLAAAKGGPLLLTARDALDGRVEAELGRALPPSSTVYLLGGTGALSPAGTRKKSPRRMSPR